MPPNKIHGLHYTQKLAKSTLAVKLSVSSPIYTWVTATSIFKTYSLLNFLPVSKVKPTLIDSRMFDMDLFIIQVNDFQFLSSCGRKMKRISDDIPILSHWKSANPAFHSFSCGEMS